MMAGEFYEFDGTGTLEPVLSGVLLPHNLASPTRFANMWKRKLAGIMRRPPRSSRPLTARLRVSTGSRHRLPAPPLLA